MTYQSIWHGDGGRHVLLRCSLTLAGPCRDGQLTCAGSGPFQLYLDGLRIAGGPGGAATESPLWNTGALSGSWDAGEHELVVVIDGGPVPSRWFAMHGQLAAAASATTAHSLESGLHWHALELPPAPTGTTAHERFSALEDPRAASVPWQGVVTVAAEPIGAAAVTTERHVEAREFAAFEETAADTELTFSPVASGARLSKFVHRDGLLAGPSAAASVQTAPDRGFGFVLDFGRLAVGIPNLRVRDGRGGTIDIGLATTWGRIDHRLRYVCGAGRQDWFGHTTVRARYIVVQLSGFDEACQIERLALCERAAAAEAVASLELGESLDEIWSKGPASLQDSRLDVYHASPPPLPCDWLGITMLLANDAVHTGHMDAARATLLGRAPTPTSELGDGAFAICLRMYHLWSGDDDTARRLQAAAVRESTAPDDPQALTRTLAIRAAGAVAAQALCHELGDAATAADCEQRLAGLREHIESRWREDRGLYADAESGADVSQYTQALVLATGAVSSERAARLAASMRGAEVTPIGDLREAFVLAHGLWSGGQGARAYDVVKNRWARIAGREGRTWREKQAAESNRLAPGPDYLLVRWLLGVTPTEGGCRTLRIRPAIALVPVGRGELPTPAGVLRVAWKRQDPAHDQQTTIQLETTGDTVAELVIDRAGRRHPSLSVNGEVVWRNEKMYPNPSVHEVGAEADEITLVFGRPGIWQIVIE